MMNKKGFTLVELLATITIIGIVSLIVIPNVIKLIKGTEQDIFNVNEESLVDAAEAYYSVNIDLLPDDLESIVIVTLDELIDGGYSKEMKGLDDGKVFCDGYVEVMQIKESMYEYTPFLDCGGKYITPGYSN
jgi:type IV pilus assembly protein PilA